MATKSNSTRDYDGGTHACVVLSATDPNGNATDLIFAGPELTAAMYDNSSGVWVVRSAGLAATVAASQIFGAYEGDGSQLSAANLLSNVNAQLGGGWT